MSFFQNITATGIAGLVLIAAGAVLTFASGVLSAKMEHKHANLILKFAGLAAVIVGFILVINT